MHYLTAYLCLLYSHKKCHSFSVLVCCTKETFVRNSCPLKLLIITHRRWIITHQINLKKTYYLVRLKLPLRAYDVVSVCFTLISDRGLVKRTFIEKKIWGYYFLPNNESNMIHNFVWSLMLTNCNIFMDLMLSFCSVNRCILVQIVYIYSPISWKLLIVTDFTCLNRDSRLVLPLDNYNCALNVMNLWRKKFEASFLQLNKQPRFPYERCIIIKIF